MIKVLLIEDSPDDVARVKKALRAGENDVFLDPFEFSTAESLSKGLDVLKNLKIDVVLLDLGLPDARDFDGIDRLKKEFPLLPIIVLTRQREETLIGIEAVKRGAQDYFSKSELSEAFSLERAVRYAIERKKHEEEIITAKEEALKASCAKSEFLSNMSHDIRTPLNCIIGVADLLAKARLRDEEVNYVRMLNKASDNLLMLINDILDLSKIESGRVKITKQPFDLLETVGSALDIVASRAHAKGIELNFKIERDVPRVLVGDSEHLNQILFNFLGNAVKFTKQGEVTLTISQARALEGKPSLRFAVKDTGIGIPSDKLSVIFDSFTQLDNAGQDLKRQGSGLGLAICKRLIDLMNGSVAVTSRVGEGSQFAFELPFDLPHKSSAEPVIPPLDLGAVECLVTAENGAHRAILKELLEYWGANVTLAANAAAAADLVVKAKKRGRRFDLALVDLRMPGIATGGIELSRKIKDDVRAIILMFPTNHRFGDLDKVKDAGVEKYFFKPTKPATLAEVISEILFQSKSKTSDAQTEVRLNRGGPLNVLVADDSEENRQLIEAYCKDSGVRLELAEDGKQAVEKFKEHDFDLVLMDIQMPAMNGYEALSAIRQFEAAEHRKPVPVLALTAFALKEEADKCLAAGFKAHVTKPIRKNELIKTIKRHAV